jgi:hypothetical protein
MDSHQRFASDVICLLNGAKNGLVIGKMLNIVLINAGKKNEVAGFSISKK